MLKLGKDIGSVVNAALVEKHIKPEVGMGATILMWSDRHAATIVEVTASGKTVTVQEDRAKRTDKNGCSESQTYEYTPNPEAPKRRFRLGKHGWKQLNSGCHLSIGHRNTYHDFSF